MTKEEFEALAEFDVTSEEYKKIEMEYMDTNLDKEKFIANWKSNDGIGQISRLRIEKISGLSEKLRCLEANYATVTERLDKKDKGRMEKYIKALEGLNKKYGSDWIKPAANAVIDVALQDYFHSGITDSEYSEICHIAVMLQLSKVKKEGA